MTPTLNTYLFRILSAGGDGKVILRPLDKWTPSSIPIEPGDVGTFPAGTNSRKELSCRISAVEYTGCFAPNFDFTVTLANIPVQLLNEIKNPGEIGFVISKIAY